MSSTQHEKYAHQDTSAVHIMKMRSTYLYFYLYFTCIFLDVVLQVSYNGSLSDTGNVPFRGTEINIGGHFSAANNLEIPNTGLYFIRSVYSLFSASVSLVHILI